jgi:hypothetical protein
VGRIQLESRRATGPQGFLKTTSICRFVYLLIGRVDRGEGVGAEAKGLIKLGGECRMAQTVFLGGVSKERSEGAKTYLGVMALRLRRISGTLDAEHGGR